MLEMGDEAAGGLVDVAGAHAAAARACACCATATRLRAAQGDSLEHQAEAPGVYRVEAYRDAHGRERTWILSNPIYLRNI